jgi:hypothetical protein
MPPRFDRYGTECIGDFGATLDRLKAQIPCFVAARQQEELITCLGVLVVRVNEVYVNQSISSFFKRHRIKVLKLRPAAAASLGPSEYLERQFSVWCRCTQRHFIYARLERGQVQ